MDGRGGCCIARYAGGAYDMSKMDRIMLRFRPIAPKPAVTGSVSGASTSGKSEVVLKSGRGKRRYVRHGNNKSSSNKRCKRKRKASPEETDNKSGGSSSVSTKDTVVVTLPLLPETPDRKDTPVSECQSDHSSDVTLTAANHGPIWLRFDSSHLLNDYDSHVDAGLDRTVVMVPQHVGLVWSYVTVEYVAETCVDILGLGCTDDEKMMNLDRDACPGFITDCVNMVKWTNGAYREMLGLGQGNTDEVRVWLVVKEGVTLPVMMSGFTCRVRVTCGKDKSSMTLPCDVWSMENGGFAWKFDVKAALRLGR